MISGEILTSVLKRQLRNKISWRGCINLAKSYKMWYHRRIKEVMSMYIYFPSCNFNRASPETGKALRQFLKAKMAIAGCCRLDQKQYQKEDTALIVCQACREVLDKKINVQSLYEYLLADENFVWPDYHGIAMNLQDCFRDIDHPEVHQAVRACLAKMHIQVVEIKHNQADADFCGTLHAEAKSPALKEALKAYPETKISKLPEKLQKALMEEQVLNYTCDNIVCYCNRCKQGIELGNGHAIHILDLIMGNAQLKSKTR